MVHPSHAIRGRASSLLAGRRIVLGISGSVAAIEVPRIARELIRHGADVVAVMSPEALRLVTPEVIEFATGHPPVVQLTGNVEHVTLLGPGEGRADLYLIAPATANTIAKIAHGIDDTPVTACASVALGGGVPILLAPAMHAHMGLNPAVRENLEKLRSWGVEIIRSQSTEGEEKLATPEEVAAAVLHRAAQGPWAGRPVIVIAGAARESIDPVRSITNESSGATGVALATEAHYRGADVELWMGSMQVQVPSFVSTRSWRGVPDLLALARSRAAKLRAASAIFVPAALSDFTVTRSAGKISSHAREGLELRLRRAPKVLPELRRLAPRPTRLVGFKLEVGRSAAELEESARRLQREAGLDWVVANDVATMGSPETTALVLPPGGGRHWIRGPKRSFAAKLLEDVGRELSNREAGRSSRAARPGGAAPRRHRP
jgi:phosphopantothenoylcysteine decarboxylase/phosphopantothenate--cysteine ligase